jgi:hypothetical protein
MAKDEALPFGVGGGLVAIKTLLSRDPCVHANTAIEMIDAILKEHPAAPVQEPVATLFGSLPVYDTTPPAAQQEHEPENEPYVSLASVQEPVAWVDLLKQAEEVVRSKSLWKKYIDGTPLANDIAVWMASFAQEHATPPAAQRQWVGLTEQEQADCFANTEDATEFYHAIEAKLKEKNT